MTMLVSRYKIEVKEEPQFAGETFEERYARVMAFDESMTVMRVMSTLHPHGDFTENVPGPSACRWFLRGDNCLRAGMDSSRLSKTVLFEFIQFSHMHGGALVGNTILTDPPRLLHLMRENDSWALGRPLAQSDKIKTVVL